MTDNKRTIFITGGAGFIGTRLAQCLSRSHDVIAFDNLHPQVHGPTSRAVAELDACGARLIKGDVRDRDSLRQALVQTRPEIVVHLAAETGTGQSFELVNTYCDVNVTGTANLIEAMRDCGTVERVLLAGSRAVYGEGACVGRDGQPTPAVARTVRDLTAGDFRPKDAKGQPLTPVASAAQTCPVAPASVYASSKLMQEFLIQQAFWGSDTMVGILRLQNVYGAGQSLKNPYTGVLSIFARQILDGRLLDIFEDGLITRDFVHVTDVARAFASLTAALSLPDHPIDIGSGQPLTILQVARQLLGHLGRGPDRLEITGHFRPGDIRHALADTSVARQALNWSPLVSAQAGMSELAAWSRTMLVASAEAAPLRQSARV